ncbi:cellulose binding domain-containing protein [Dactylosporangium cerinum]
MSALSAWVRRSWHRIVTARDWSADRRSQAVAAAAAILLLLAMIALLVGKATAPHPAKPPRTGGGVEGPAQATVPAAPAERSPRVAVVPATSAPTGPPPAVATSAPSAATTGPQLTARTRTEDLTLTSYRVTVTIANPSTAPSTDWTVVIVLPLLDLTVRDVDGAVMSRTGLKVIFTPVDSTRTIRNGGSVTFRFEVEGLGVRSTLLDCTIDGRPCTQVSG